MYCKALGRVSRKSIWLLKLTRLSNSHLHRQTLPPAGHCRDQTAAISPLAQMKIWTPFQGKGGTRVTVHIMFFPFVREKVHFKKKFLCISLSVRPLLIFTFGHPGSLLLCAAFSSCSEQGGYSRCGVPASCCIGFSRCGAWVLGAWASRVEAQGLSSLPTLTPACGIFPDQGLNSCPLHWQADSYPLTVHI